jgi:hypothetical protein
MKLVQKCKNMKKDRRHSAAYPFFIFLFQQRMLSSALDVA